MLLNREAIHKADDLPNKVVYVDEWGGEVKLKALSAKDRILFEKVNVNKSELETMVNLIIFSCVDEDNNKIFKDEDYDFLANKSANVLVFLFEQAIELSTLSKKGVEQLAKNS